MIHFSDILKGKFLEEFSAIALDQMLLGIALSFALGLFVVFIYRATYAGVNYSGSFAACMVMICMVTTVVILVISSNVVLSLGMVGALSIVRFRTAVKEPTDTAFLFWAIATGILCGTGYFVIAILATLLLGLLFVGMHSFGKTVKSGSYMVVLRCGVDCKAEEVLAGLPAYRLKSKNLVAEKTELVAEVRLNAQDMAKVESLRDLPGVQEISIMASVSGSVL